MSTINFAWNKYLAECIGTYCLVFAGTGAIIVNDLNDGVISHLGIALTFGMIVLAMIYSIGDLSGAHINPAVTIAFFVAKRFSGQHVLPYVVAQTLGAIMASLTLKLLFAEHENLGSTLPSVGWWQTFILEFILTAILMFVILRVSSGSRETGIMAGAAIGITVALEAIFAGPVCGASMNPARSFGPAIVSGNLQFLWIYLVATTLGACFAILLDRMIHERADDEIN